MAGVEMVDRHPVELRSQILFHLRHQPAPERLEVGILIAVLGRDDQAELMTIVATTYEKRLLMGGSVIVRIQLAPLALARPSLPQDIRETSGGPSDDRQKADCVERVVASLSKVGGRQHN